MEEISEKWKALGDHAKRKYKKKSIRSSEKYKEHKIKLDLPKAPKVVIVSMFIHMLFSFYCSREID